MGELHWEGQVIPLTNESITSLKPAPNRCLIGIGSLCYILSLLRYPLLSCIILNGSPRGLTCDLLERVTFHTPGCLIWGNEIERQPEAAALRKTFTITLSR